MTRIFISHSAQDDAFVGELRQMLADHGQAGWIDSRELRGGDPLWPDIQSAIEQASAYVVVVSTDSLQSTWVGHELMHALKLRGERGKHQFPVIPLSLNGSQLGVLETLFGDEPVYIPVSSEAGGVEAAMNALLVALGQRKAADVAADMAANPQPPAAALEELVLALSDFRFIEHDGARRASARARLVYEPATRGQESVHSVQHWRLIAPLGPIEVAELRWYLEKFAVWPNEVFRQRALKVDAALVTW
ncbi:MAG: toll/interleukin-1 receptor domain-containing protein, partial [Microbacteriaceae bacterium]|nr:toll/interleukin-1 receptor domain-containing protein [Burkholderiaceae bacterium]